MRFAALGVASSFFLVSIASAQVTRRASIPDGSTEGDGYSTFCSVSADGRWIAFFSLATNLVPGDTNGMGDVFVQDRLTGTIERVSVGPRGVQADDFSIGPSISADGRYVAFYSGATNLVAGDTNGCYDVFVRDRVAGTTVRASVDSSGAQAEASSDEPSISADGRFVAFRSFSRYLVPVDDNFVPDVFVRDLVAGTTERVSVGPGGLQANDQSNFPSISADGRFVAFLSYASNLVAGDTNGTGDVFVRDRQSGTTERVSVRTSTGAQANAYSGMCSISGDGRLVAFESAASNLVVGDSNTTDDVFVRDRTAGTTVRVSVSTGGSQAFEPSFVPSISRRGRRSG